MPQDNWKTPTPTEVLDQAMLGILKVGAPFRSEEQSSSELLEKTKPASSGLDEMRSAIASATVARHPGLTEEEVLKQMEAMGF